MAEHYSKQSNHPELDFNEASVKSQTLSNKAIFRHLIGEEIRNGRLSAHRRKRIVQYASHLGISAVEMGQMIEQCSQGFYLDAVQQNTQTDIRLVEESDDRRSTAIISCLAGVGFIVIAMLYIAYAG